MLRFLGGDSERECMEDMRQWSSPKYVKSGDWLERRRLQGVLGFVGAFCLPTTTHILATNVVIYGLDACSVTDRLGMSHARRARRNTPLLD